MCVCVCVLARAFFGQEEALEKFVKGTLTNNLAVWEKLLSKGDTKYIANNKRSIADVEVFLLLEIFEALTPQVLAEFPHLQTFLGDFKVVVVVVAVRVFFPKKNGGRPSRTGTMLTEICGLLNPERAWSGRVPCL